MGHLVSVGDRVAGGIHGGPAGNTGQQLHHQKEDQMHGARQNIGGVAKE